MCEVGLLNFILGRIFDADLRYENDFTPRFDDDLQEWIGIDVRHSPESQRTAFPQRGCDSLPATADIMRRMTAAARQRFESSKFFDPAGTSYPHRRGDYMYSCVHGRLSAPRDPSQRGGEAASVCRILDALAAGVCEDRRMPMQRACVWRMSMQRAWILHAPLILLSPWPLCSTAYGDADWEA